MYGLIIHTRAERYYRLSDISRFYMSIDLAIFASNYRDIFACTLIGKNQNGNYTCQLC